MAIKLSDVSLGTYQQLVSASLSIIKKAENYFTEIEKLGGVIPAIEDGYFQREISRSSSEYQAKVDKNRRIVIGVNKYKDNSNENKLFL